jgi:hypothetical protein
MPQVLVQRTWLLRPLARRGANVHLREWLSIAVMVMLHMCRCRMLLFVQGGQPGVHAEEQLLERHCSALHKSSTEQIVGVGVTFWRGHEYRDRMQR